MANNDYSLIEEELKKMKEDEIRHIRTGPGRTGLVTLKKGKKLPQPTNIEDMKPKSKVISSAMPLRIN